MYSNASIARQKTAPVTPEAQVWDFLSLAGLRKSTAAKWGVKARLNPDRFFACDCRPSSIRVKSRRSNFIMYRVTVNLTHVSRAGIQLFQKSCDLSFLIHLQTFFRIQVHNVVPEGVTYKHENIHCQHYRVRRLRGQL